MIYRSVSGIGKGGVISGALFLGRCVALAILFVTRVETMGWLRVFLP